MYFGTQSGVEFLRISVMMKRVGCVHCQIKVKAQYVMSLSDSMCGAHHAQGKGEGMISDYLTT